MFLEFYYFLDGRGYGASNFCSGAGLDEIDENLTYEMYERNKQTNLEQNNSAFEKEAIELNENNEKTEYVVEDVQTASVPEKLPFYKKAFFFICGIETLRNQKKDEVEPEPNVSIETDPFWSKVIDLVALFVAAVAGFFIAFFNKY